MPRNRLYLPLIVVPLLLPFAAFCQAAPEAEWWKTAVFYEIYPRSFQDSNGDGIGDLNGIRQKLPYLARLGVDAVWITPFYPSPQVDFGYDVADYENVDPQFGTLADFDRLLAEAHRLRVRVIIDLVLNHTSDKHPYFLKSRESRTSPYRDWYIWRDGKNGGPPNNWSSAFGPTAWTFDQKTGQWYYHYYYSEQPDLNWRNPAVQQALFNSVRFWLKRGVDGFRLDAVSALMEDPNLTDNPVLPTLRKGSATERDQQRKYNRELPELHRVLQDLRKVTDEYGPGRLLIGEASASTMKDLMAFYGPSGNEVQLPFNFFFTRVPKLEAPLFRAEVEKAEQALGDRWTTWVLSNHDQVRAFDRYGDGQHNDEIAKMLGLMLLTLRGSPFLYYGEEIGMQTTAPKRVEDVQDPVGKRYWPENKGRDGERTPMQWTPGANAGFTPGRPWLPVPASAGARNVETESKAPNSVLEFYRRVLQLRRATPALLEGGYEALGADGQVFAYRRSAAGKSVVVALNMSPAPAMIELPASGSVLIDSISQRPPALQGRTLRLAPYQAVVVGLQ